jgi:hypothetical protein
MRLAGMNQLGVAVKESLQYLTIDNHTEVDEKAPSIQNTYVDSVVFSDRAIELSMQADTEKGSNEEFDTGFKEESDSDQRQEEDPGANQQQEPAFTAAGSLNVLA